MGEGTQSNRAGGGSAIYDALPAGPMLTEADLALIWAALVAFRESVPTEDTGTHAQLGRLLAVLADEQVRRHPRQQAPATPEKLTAASHLPWSF